MDLDLHCVTNILYETKFMAREMKSILKTRNICSLWIIFVPSDDQMSPLYSSDCYKNWTDGTQRKKCLNPENTKMRKKRDVSTSCLTHLCMSCGVISIRNHVHNLFSISLLCPPSFRLPTSELQKLNYQQFKTKVPEAWYEQEDKYNLFLLSFVFPFLLSFFLFLQYILLVILLCSFNDVKLERRPQALVLMLIVHSLLSVCFGCALLWHRCCKKEKKKKGNREVKLQTEHQSEFFGISLFLSRFQERVFFGGKPNRIPKSLQ